MTENHEGIYVLTTNVAHSKRNSLRIFFFSTIDTCCKHDPKKSSNFFKQYSASKIYVRLYAQYFFLVQKLLPVN